MQKGSHHLMHPFIRPFQRPSNNQFLLPNQPSQTLWLLLRPHLCQASLTHHLTPYGPITKMSQASEPHSGVESLKAAELESGRGSNTWVQVRLTASDVLSTSPCCHIHAKIWHWPPLVSPASRSDAFCISAGNKIGFMSKLPIVPAEHNLLGE